MKKRMLCLLLGSILLAACSSQTANKTDETAEETAPQLELVAKTDEQNTKLHYFLFNSEETGYRSERSNVLTPTFYIYAGNKSEK